MNKNNIGLLWACWSRWLYCQFLCSYVCANLRMKQSRQSREKPTMWTDRTIVLNWAQLLNYETKRKQAQSLHHELYSSTSDVILGIKVLVLRENVFVLTKMFCLHQYYVSHERDIPNSDTAKRDLR